MPTVLNHYGAQEDPWTVDLETAAHGRRAKKDAVRISSLLTCRIYWGNMLTILIQAARADGAHDLVDVLQEMVDSLYPHHFQKFKFNDHLVRVVRHRLALACQTPLMNGSVGLSAHYQLATHLLEMSNQTRRQGLQGLQVQASQFNQGGCQEVGQ